MATNPAATRYFKVPVAQHVANAYIEFIRNTPLILQLFFIAFGLPRLLGYSWPFWGHSLLALTLNFSAYLSDVWRGAIEAVPVGQWEGGKALGLSFLQIVRLLIVPQAFRISLAPTVGFMVQIIKGTPLTYIIGFHDLMSIEKRWANAPVDGTEPFMIYSLMALVDFLPLLSSLALVAPP